MAVHRRVVMIASIALMLQSKFNSVGSSGLQQRHSGSWIFNSKGRGKETKTKQKQQQLISYVIIFELLICIYVPQN